MGIASPESTIASYTNFTTNVLPRIKDLGKTWDRIIYIRLFSSLLASILFCQLLRSLSGAQQSSGCDPLLPSVSQGFCWLNSRTFCIFCGQEQRGNEALSWRLYMPLYTPKTEPTKWDGKTVIKGFVSHLLIPASVVCHLCLRRSVTQQTCNATSSAAAPPVFSVTDPVTLLLHKTTSASQHPVYWHDLKGSLTVRQCFVEQASQHRSHTTQQLWLQNWQLVSISMSLTQVANHEQVLPHIVSLSKTNKSAVKIHLTVGVFVQHYISLAIHPDSPLTCLFWLIQSNP